jgi:hypothetical protein
LSPWTEEEFMSCEHLVCAQCAGPVAEGRCSVCRAGRERVHHQHITPSSAVILTLIALVLALTVLVERFAT